MGMGSEHHRGAIPESLDLTEGNLELVQGEGGAQGTVGECLSKTAIIVTAHRHFTLLSSLTLFTDPAR